MNSVRRLWFFAILFYLLPVNNAYSCGYNYISSCATQIDLTSNGVPSTFFVGNCTYLTNLDGYNFGTVNDLTLTKATEMTWESCTNRVMNTKVYYRIYALGTTPGAFTILDLNTLTLGGIGDYRNRTFVASPDADLLAGLTNGTTYTLELYYFSEVDFNQDNIPNDNLTRNNSGANYKATFKKGGTTGGLAVVISSKTNVRCAGGNDGNATVSATGGTAPYTYHWSNGTNSQSIQNVPAGSYIVTATASNGVTGSATAIISQPQPLNADLVTTDESNATANNGKIVSNTTGGTSPYTYIWSNGSTTSNLTNLDAGTYSVTIRDTKSCQITRTVTVNTGGTVPTGYCTPNSIFPWNEWIGTVILGTLNNNSDKQGYSNFTTLPATALNIGDAYAVTLKTGTGWFAYPETWRIWIDYNRNGIFDANEIALEAQSASTVYGVNQLIVNQSITIPSSATAGITRMRIAIKRDGAALPCESISYGEFEDYNVNLIASTTCSIVASVNNNLCNNAGTTNTGTDDTYTFSLTVSGTGSGWKSTVNGQAVTGTYGVAKTMGPYLISAGTLAFTVADNANATCTFPVSVPPPPSCSTSGGTSPSGYCQSKGDFPWQEWISNVNFGGINNASGKWYYSDFTSKIASVAKGQSYPFVVSSSYSWDINSYFKVWIDYNRDGVFQEPGEIAYSGQLTGYPNGAQNAPLNSTISIPTTASVGNTRMRVAMKRGAYPTPCENPIAFGEVEDYTVNIATSLLNGNNNRESLLKIYATAENHRNRIQTILNVSSAVQNVRLERAGTDFEWETVDEWINVYLPELENVQFRTFDEHPLEGINYYRLAIGLTDGRILFSNVESLSNFPIAEFGIFPNPASGNEISLNVENLLGKDLEIKLFHITGKFISTMEILELTDPILQIPINGLANGEYMILLQSKGMRPVSKKLVVIKE